MNKRKIIFVVTKSNWGGAQRYVYDLATNLPSDKFETVVAFGGTGSLGAEEGELAYRLREVRISTRFIRAFARDVHLWQEVKAFFELLRLFKKERPDVVHLNSSKAGGIGALAARIAKVPRIVYTPHGLASDERRNMLSRIAIRCATLVTFLLSHKVIAISRYLAWQIARYPGTKGKIVQVYNGVGSVDFLARDAARLAIVPAELADRHSHDIWLLSIAELHPNKNVGVAIDAVTRYNDSHPHGRKIFYIVAGDGELREKLEKDIERRRMKEHIALPGFIPAAARLMKAFDLFALPSRKEGLPYVLLEAGLADVPVVASNVGGIPEIIEDGVSGYLLAPNDAAGFARRIDELLSQPKLCEQFADALEHKVRTDFSLERMVAHTAAAYVH
jgi:glycosyltransferase involved in cell wall biosynthesis